MSLIKKILKDPVFVGLAILLCMQLNWEWSNIKSFLTGGAIVFSGMVTYFYEGD